jgi:hypothetical protein
MLGLGACGYEDQCWMPMRQDGCYAQAGALNIEIEVDGGQIVKRFRSWERGWAAGDLSCNSLAAR